MTDILSVLSVLVIALSAIFLSFKAGELRGEAEGRKRGHALCVAQYDEDFAPGKRYATRAK